MDRQWCWLYAIKFARWQHHAVGYTAKFALFGSASYYYFFLIAIISVPY